MKKSAYSPGAQAHMDKVQAGVSRPSNVPTFGKPPVPAKVK